MGNDDQALGQLLVRHLLARPEDVKAALEAQAAERARGAPWRPIGEILVERGVLTAAQLELVLSERKKVARVGPFEVLARLGEGGMGVVYKARPVAGGAPVALKVLSKRFADSPEAVARFRREAALGQALEHPNVVRTLDFGEDRGQHYIAFELMEGGDLSRRLRQSGALPEREALEIARQVALALGHAQERGLVHRDVKPSNVMFAAGGAVKLSDFGLVKSLDPEASHLTLEGSALGTPHYISPEQAMGDKHVDVRADIYSLGATLYHLLTGRPPFDGGTPIEVIQKHLHERLTPPDELVPSLSDGCVALIERMMAKERADRYASPAEVAADIERVLAGQEPRAEAIDDARSSLKRSQRRRERLRRPPAFASTRRVAIRRPSRAPWAVGAAAALALAVGGIVVASRGRPPEPEPVQRRPSAAVEPPRPVPAVEDREERAKLELGAILRDGGDRGRLEAFVRAYEGTFAAAEARSRLKPAAGWTSIFNGRDLEGWHKAQERVIVREGMIRLDERGEVMRRVESPDFELRGKWRVDNFGEAGAACLFLRQPKIERGGPMIVMHWDGDVHLKNEGWGTIAKTGQGACKVGRWQSFTLRAKGRAVELEIDGKRALAGEIPRVEGGWMGFYAIEGALFWVRDLDLRQ